jgi:purine-binding chemotaxis protein CheW
MSDELDIRESLADEVEEVLRRRAEALARKAEEDTTLQRSSLLVFRVGAFWYAVGVEAIREIFRDYEVAAIPCAPEFVRGVVSIRGEIVSVTDAATLMGVASAAGSGATSAAVVLENAECTTALLVDEVGGIIDVPASGVEPPLPAMEHAGAEYVTATVFLGDRLVSVVNVDRVLQPIGAGAP